MSNKPIDKEHCNVSSGDKCCSEERSTRTRGQIVGRFGADSDDRQGEVAFEEYLGVTQESPCHPPPLSHCWRTRGPPPVGGLEDTSPLPLLED